ncbi:MAG TPA: polysaccharide deacetylase family protein [Candidatus Hydrogenedentes bacterium]|nr:polysaccharide deacetylase family protein [Candidatus Hydrogenedentota bacterium]
MKTDWNGMDFRWLTRRVSAVRRAAHNRYGDIMSRFLAVTIFMILLAAGLFPIVSLPVFYLVCVILAIVYAVAFGLGLTFIQMQYFCRAACRGGNGRCHAAFTFDDGPDPDVTPQILEVLARRRIKATFFCIGSRIEAHGELARKIVEEGHVLGNHSYRHAWWTNFFYGRRLYEEIERAQQIIRTVTGRSPRYYHPPMGLTNPHLPRALKRAELLLAGWSFRSFDRLPLPPERVIRRIARKTRNGSIILLHDGGARAERIVVILEGVIDALQARGFEFVTLDQLLEKSSPPAPHSQQKYSEH